MEVIVGKVIRGDGYGKRLGFPTANLDRRQWVKTGLKIPFGIYAGLVVLPNQRTYKAGIVIGPLDRRGLPKLEAHLIGYTGSLYNKRLTFVLKFFLRKFKKYRSEVLLRQDIKRDIQKINKLTLSL